MLDFRSHLWNYMIAFSIIAMKVETFIVRSNIHGMKIANVIMLDGERSYPKQAFLEKKVFRKVWAIASLSKDFAHF